jgi:hypothetical protein
MSQGSVDGTEVVGNRPALIGPDHEAPLTIEVDRDAATEVSAGRNPGPGAALLAGKEARHWGYEAVDIELIRGNDPERVTVELVVTGA